MEVRGSKNAKFFVRILPSDDFSHKDIKVETNFKVMYVRSLQNMDRSFSDNTEPKFWRFSTDGIFFRDPHEQIYDVVMNNILKRALEGTDSVIFAYGQTGSGKSTTISVITDQLEYCGLAPALLSEMFAVQDKCQYETRIQFTMSYVEFIGPQISDLLVQGGSKPSKLNRHVLKKILRVPIVSICETLRWLRDGASRRCVDRNAPYEGSNQGHSILTIHVENVSLVKARPVIATAKIHLVDMSGINCTGRATSYWRSSRLQGQSNLTKTLLEQCLLHMNKSPYETATINHLRLDPFIQYLGDSFSRKSLLRFVGHIHGSFSNLDITLSTLRFGELVSELKPDRLAFHVKPEPNLQLINMEEELLLLRQQLQLSAMFVSEPDIANISQGRVDHLRRLAKSFLDGNSSGLVISAIQQKQLATELLREHVTNLQADCDNTSKQISELKKEEEEEAAAASMLCSSLGSLSFVAPHASSSKGSRKSSLLSKESLKTITAGASLRNGGTNGSIITVGSKTRVLGKKPRNSVTNKTSRSKSVKSATLKDLREETPGSSSTKDSGDLVVEPLPKLPSYQIPSFNTAWTKFVSMGLVQMDVVQRAIARAEKAKQQAEDTYEKAAVDVKREYQILDKLLATKQSHYKPDAERKISQKSFVMKDDEMPFSRTLAEAEVEVNNKQETLKVRRIEVIECSKHLENLKKQIEQCFQEFCLATYGAPCPIETNCHKEPTKDAFQSIATGEREQHFRLLQEATFAASKNSSVMKKPKIYSLHCEKGKRNSVK